MKNIKTLIVRLAVVCAIALACVPSIQPAVAQSEPAAQNNPATSANPALDALQKRFERLFKSLQAKGSVADNDRKFVTSLMDDLDAYIQSHPTSRKALAMQTQLAIVLKDNDRVFDLFNQLMKADPSNDQLAQDWLTYFNNSDTPERANDVINHIIEIGPDSDALRRICAESLRKSMQYQRVIDFLNQIPLDPKNNPAAIILLSDAQFAQQQFQDSLDTLNMIPQDVIDNNATIKSQIDQKKPDREDYVGLWAKEQEIRSAEAAADDLPRVEIITDKGRIVAELFENEAPNTVANFITLAEKHFYDGTSFHRVLANFMCQGGDPYSKEGATGIPGTGDPGYHIPDEHDRPDHRNHFSGSLSMAKTAAPNTAGCGFYITFEPTPWLNGRHTVFGTVTEGLDVVRKIKQDDRIKAINVLRKRPHEYTVQKLPLPGQPLPDESAGGATKADGENNAGEAPTDTNGDETTADDSAENADDSTGESDQP